MPLLRNLLIAIATTAAQADVPGFLQAPDMPKMDTPDMPKMPKMPKMPPLPKPVPETVDTTNNAFERVWMVCEQPKSKAPSAGEKAAGMPALEPAKCTDQFSFQNLCCAGFAKEDFKHSGVLGLDSTKYLTTSSTQAEKVIKVCTQASNGMALMSQAKSDAATMPVECTKLDITEAQLAGKSDGLQPGEIVLRERLLFFAGQQIPISNVPTCEQAVKICPGGKKPTTVQAAWLAKTKESLLQGKMGMDAMTSQLKRLMTSQQNAFSGSLMTSGSFTMVGGSGD